MASIAPVSQEQLTTRRKKLRRARRIRSFQAVWRSLFGVGMAGSLVWAITLPDWVIRQPEQVVIEGNRFLSDRSVRSLLPLSYPQSLLRVEPQAIADSLEREPPIADATVSRQLLPPGLTVRVKERKPVALAMPTASPNLKSDRVGLLDDRGVWMQASSYKELQPNIELPTLKVIGLHDRYRPYWSDAYQSTSHSPVKIFEIDWQDPTNLILKTELGTVHIGPFTPRFTEQLAVLDRMRELPAHISPSQIAYIDLKNPDFPAIQLTKKQ